MTFATASRKYAARHILGRRGAPTKMRGSIRKWFIAATATLVGCSTARGVSQDVAVDAGDAPATTRATAPAGARGALTFDAAHAEARGDGWRWTMALSRWGRADAMHAVPRPARPTSDRHRATFEHEGVREWYATGPGGIEQGFDVARAPEGSGVLRFELSSEGATARAEGDRVAIVDAGGKTRARLGALSAKDADGRSLAATFEVRSGAVAVTVDDHDARYPIVIDPTLWVEQATIQETVPTSGDYLGAVLAISGGTVLARADTVPPAAVMGQIYAFTQSGTTWSQEGAPFAVTGLPGGVYFGGGIALEGDTAAISVTDNGTDEAFDGGVTPIDSAYVFARSGSQWTQQATLSASDGASLGPAIAIDGDTIAVGVQLHPDEVFVFTRSGTTWAQQGGPLRGSSVVTGDQFGASLALSGTHLVVGAREHASGTGAAYAFERSGTTWAQVGDRIIGSDTAAQDLFGQAVALNGDTLVVGASNHALTSTTSGAVYAFSWASSAWTQTSELMAPANAMSFGGDVLMSGTDVLIGDAEDVGGSASGCRVYNLAGASWSAEGPPLMLPSGAFGASALAIDGGVVVVGGAGTADDISTVYVFEGLSTGTACTADSDCPTAHCSKEGVCCNTACAGGCESCVLAATVGTCTQLPAGTSGTCGVYACGAATTCGTACITNADCISGYTCSEHACVPSTSPGAEAGVEAGATLPAPISATDAKSCKSASDCGSGFCVDGICCDQACTATCMTCTLETAIGHCVASPLGDDAKLQCPGGACVSTCDGNGACTAAFTGATCAPSSCTGAATGHGPSYCAAGATSCDTTGATDFDCTPYGCAVAFGACFSTCATSDDCAPSYVCDTSKTPGVCVSTSSGATHGGCAIDRRGGDARWSCLAALIAIAAVATRRSRRAR